MIRPQTFLALSLAVLAACAQKKDDAPQARQWHVTVPATAYEAFSTDEKTAFTKFVTTEQSVKMFNPMDYMFTHGKDRSKLSDVQRTLIIAAENSKAICNSNEEINKSGSIQHPGDSTSTDVNRYIKDAPNSKCPVNASTHLVLKLTAQKGAEGHVLLGGPMNVTNSIVAADADTGAIIGAGTTSDMKSSISLDISEANRTINISGSIVGASGGNVIPTGAPFYAYTLDSSLWVNLAMVNGGEPTGNMEIALSLNINNAQPKRAVIGVRVALAKAANNALVVQDKEVTLNGVVLTGQELDTLLNSELVGNAILAQINRLADLPLGLRAKTTLNLAGE